MAELDRVLSPWHRFRGAGLPRLGLQRALGPMRACLTRRLYAADPPPGSWVHPRMDTLLRFSPLAVLHSPLALMVASVVGGAGVLAWRFQETQNPLTARRIIIPPLGMSTGLCMFLAPPMRVPWTWALGAFLLGAFVFSYPLLLTSTMTREGDTVMLRRSKAFLVILLGLLAVRLALHDYVGRLVSPTQTAAVFFLLAFGMILRWRIGMYLQYRKLLAAPAGRPA